jgi:radical SAM protein with 4Fe4S-binding SPASM domain
MSKIAFDLIALCWNGFITPCCAKPFPKELNFGNVFEDNVMNVLNSKGFRDFRDLWFKNITPGFCYKCHFIDIKPINS